MSIYNTKYQLESSYSMKETRMTNFLKSSRLLKKSTNIFIPFCETLLEPYWYDDIDKPRFSDMIFFMT